MATAGERHNNPGCIMGSNGLKQFSSLEEGYEALNSLLFRKYNNRTCFEIFKQYAPYSDGNNPRQYADFVIKQLNQKGIAVTDSTVLNLNNPIVLQELTLAISKMENGKVLGGEDFARNCSQYFAYEKGLSSTAPTSLAHRTTQNASTIRTLSQLTPNNQMVNHSIKHQELAAKQAQTAQNIKPTENNSSIVSLLLSAATALLAKNSKVGSLIATLMQSSAQISNSNANTSNQIAVTDKDNQLS